MFCHSCESLIIWYSMTSACFEKTASFLRLSTLLVKRPVEIHSLVNGLKVPQYLFVSSLTYRNLVIYWIMCLESVGFSFVKEEHRRSLAPRIILRRIG